jgi:predicted anti-sigma-YlaC factor YlaD
MSAVEPCAAWLEAISCYLDGVLTPPEEHAVHAHMHGCEPCAQYLVDLVPVVQMLQGLPAAQPSRDCWPAIAHALREDPHFYRRRGWRVLMGRPAVGWAAAGVMLFAITSVSYMGYQQQASIPVADMNLYWHQHELFSQEEGVPSLYTPELNAIEASYQLDE